MTAKMVCQMCRRRIPVASFCRRCGKPTPFATPEERAVYEMEMWASSRKEPPRTIRVEAVPMRVATLTLDEPAFVEATRREPLPQAPITIVAPRQPLLHETAGQEPRPQERVLHEPVQEPVREPVVQELISEDGAPADAVPLETIGSDLVADEPVALEETTPAAVVDAPTIPPDVPATRAPHIDAPIPYGPIGGPAGLIGGFAGAAATATRPPAIPRTTPAIPRTTPAIPRTTPTIPRTTPPTRPQAPRRGPARPAAGRSAAALLARATERVPSAPEIPTAAPEIRPGTDVVPEQVEQAAPATTDREMNPLEMALDMMRSLQQPAQETAEPEREEGSKQPKKRSRRERRLDSGLRRLGLLPGETITMSIEGWSRLRRTTLIVTRYRVALVFRSRGRTVRWLPLEEVTKIGTAWYGAPTLLIDSSVEIISFRKRSWGALAPVTDLLVSEIREARGPGARRHHPDVVQAWCERTELWETDVGRVRIWVDRHPGITCSFLASMLALALLAIRG